MHFLPQILMSITSYYNIDFNSVRNAISTQIFTNSAPYVFYSVTSKHEDGGRSDQITQLYCTAYKLRGVLA